MECTEVSDGDRPSTFAGKIDSLNVTLDETTTPEDCLSQSQYALEPGSKPRKIILLAVGDSLDDLS